MRKVLLFILSLIVATASAQQVNVNQLRPSTTNGQVVTTVGGVSQWAGLNINNNFAMNAIPPVSGQYVSLCSGSQSGSGSDSSQIYTYSPCAGAVTAAGGPIGAPHSASVTWSGYSLPSYVNPANVSAVYAAITMRAETSGIGSWTFVCNSQAVGTTSVTATRQFNALLTGVTGSNIGSLSCTVSASHSGGNADTFTFVNASVDVFVYYTGTPPPTPNVTNIQPPLNWDQSTEVLSLDVPLDTGTDNGTANNYLVNLGGTPLFIPGLAVKFLPGNNNTSTTPTMSVNGHVSGTIVGPRGGALVSGDISNTVVAEVILESTGSSPVWSLQNPQVSSTAPVSSVSNSDGSLTCSPTTGAVVCSLNVGHSNTWTANQIFNGGFDASGASQVKLPVAAGYASAANGEVGYDSTNKNWHLYANGADYILVPLASGFTSGHCANITSTGGTWTMADAGGPCGTGSGGDTVTSPNGTINVGGTATNTTLDVNPVSTVVDTSTPVTVTTTKPAEFHFNENATAATAITYNLPTAAAGKQFCFANAYNGSAANTGTLELLTSASGQFIVFTDGTLSATGGYVISGGAAADAACVVGIDSTHWMLYVQSGTWTKH